MNGHYVWTHGKPDSMRIQSGFEATCGQALCNTVWPEILAEIYFGRLLKICHLAEFTLAVEPGLAIMIFIAKWLIERAGNLTGP